MFELSGDPDWLEKARGILLLLRARLTSAKMGAGWGYPFDWQSRVMIPAGTPSGVVTSFCFRGALRWYELTGDKEFFEMTRGAASFLADGLNVDRVSESQVCFSYTPLDNFHVHNANVLVAASLMQASKAFDDERFARLAGQAISYTVSEQNPDGSWDYFGRAEKLPGHIDNYHTGFVLKALLDYVEGGNHDDELPSAIMRGVEYYLVNLFFKEFLPRYSNRISYPIDIHGCADSIATLTRLSELGYLTSSKAERLVQWTTDKMYDRKGGFYYQKYPFMTSKGVFMRWNNAWMFYALTEYLKVSCRHHAS